MARCAICYGEIETQDSGWDQGHNADPITYGRCCAICNTTRVLPQRLKDIKANLREVT